MDRTKLEPRVVRRLALDALGQKLGVAEKRANSAITEERVRETLFFLAFEEVSPGHFVRLDAPDGRADDLHAARFVTTVRLGHVIGNAAALDRLVKRFSRVHGRLER